MQYRFDRLEAAGSLGDIGTLLPIALGMILINGLDAAGLFLAVGLYYIISGIYFGTPTPVQPMKVIGAYAVATGLSPNQIHAASLILGVLLLTVGYSNLMRPITRFVEKAVIRGVQLSTGMLLLTQGCKLILGQSLLQKMHDAAEPNLLFGTLLGIPTGWIFGALAFFLTLRFLDSKRYPAGLVVVGFGLVCGLLFGTHSGLSGLALSFNLPTLLPDGLPDWDTLGFALVILVLPQLPMTVGNAVIANADLSEQYFGNDSRKVTEKGLCLSMGFANIGSFLLGGMPMCHGAGGLAAHYRFGARTPGSNIIIGAVFIFLALLLGPHIPALAGLLPFSVLGVLLIFAGTTLCLTISDLPTRSDLFIAMLMLGITLVCNLAVSFVVGAIMARLIRSGRLTI